jgi:hypothetical protein
VHEATGHDLRIVAIAAPINMCQIGLVTRQSRLIATFCSCAVRRLPLFLFLIRKSDTCIFVEKISFGRTFCLARMASASLRPRRDVTAIEQGEQVETAGTPTFPCASQDWSHSLWSLTWQPPSSAPFCDPFPSDFHLTKPRRMSTASDCKEWGYSRVMIVICPC